MKKPKRKLALRPRAKARPRKAAIARKRQAAPKSRAQIPASRPLDGEILPPQPRARLDQIYIGDRHRKDYGDLDGLAASIDERGELLQPVVVRRLAADDKKRDRGFVFELVAGERRIRAWPKTRFANDLIPIRIVDIEKIVLGERDENLQRKAFTRSEAVAIARECEPIEKAMAIVRQRAGKKSEDKSASGAVGTRLAELVGMDRKTLQKAREIVEAAEAEPAKYQKLVDQMDRTGNVNGPHRRLSVLKQAEGIRKEPPPMPGKGPYKAGAIDMPWASEPDGKSPSETGRAFFHYATMNSAEMIAFGKRVVPLLHPDGGYLWFWVPTFHLIKRHAFKVLDAWSDLCVAGGLGPLEIVHMRTWAKDKHGNGQILFGKTEHVLLVKWGNAPAVNLTNETTLIEGPVRAHSEKPENFYRDVENLTPAPRYFELFARRDMPDNWDGFGDQVGTLGAAVPEHTAAIDQVAAVLAGKVTNVTIGGVPVDQLAAADAPAVDQPAAPKRSRKRKPPVTPAPDLETASPAAIEPPAIEISPAPIGADAAEEIDHEAIEAAADAARDQVVDQVEAAPAIEISPAAAEPTLPGIPAADPAPEKPAVRPIELRRAIDDAVEARPHMEILINTHPALYDALDEISERMGAGAGYACYPVPLEWDKRLAAIEAALAGLTPERLHRFALGVAEEQAAIAGADPALALARDMINAFAGGWREEAKKPPAGDDSDQFDIPTFLRRSPDEPGQKGLGRR